MKHTRSNRNGMTRHMRMLLVCLIAVIVLIIGATVPQAWASGYHWRVPFAEKEIFFEYNSTDQDLGLHIFFDAQAWEEVEVKGPDGEIFEVENDGSLSELGSTEVFTESAEPPLCEEEDPEDCTDEEIEQAIEEFQAQFPEGWYRFRGRTTEGKRLRGRAWLSHELPDPPVILTPEEGDPLTNPFIISWDPMNSDVISYEVVAEMVINERTFVNTAVLPGNATQLTVSPEFIHLAEAARMAGTLEEFKVEVIRRLINLNKTISELAVLESE